MIFVWIGVAFLLAKWFAIGPVAGLDWWWALLPFGLAFVWFEFLEKLFGYSVREIGVVAQQERAAARRAENLRGHAATPKRGGKG